MFYSLNTPLPPSSFALTSSRWRWESSVMYWGLKWRKNWFYPKGVLINVKTPKTMVWLLSSCTDRISNNDFLISYINLSPAMAWCITTDVFNIYVRGITKVHKRKLLYLLYRLLPVWQHPNEPRGSNQSEFELNIVKKNDLEIIDYNKLNHKIFTIIYVHWMLKMFWLIYPTLYEASFSGEQGMSNLDYYFQDGGKTGAQTNQSFWKLNNIFWWSKVSLIIIKGWNFMIKSFSGQVVLFCYPRAISAYFGENWLSQYTGTIEFDRANFEKKTHRNKTKTQEKSFGCVLPNEECPQLLSSLGIDHRRRKAIPLWNSSGENEFFRASLYVLYLQYWALCDALVVFKLWAGAMYLSFSMDTAPECILWKRSREDRSLRASRDGHSSSWSISPTLLVFRLLLQVQRVAVLWTFSTWLIWSFE